MSAQRDTGSESEMQRILALKRHEQPPPTFFQGFSEKVIDRIQTEGASPKLTLRQRLSMEFYGLPIYVCLSGVIVVSLLVAGLVVSLRVDTAKTKHLSHPTDSALSSEPSHSIVPPPADVPAGTKTSAATDPTSPRSSDLNPTRATLADPAASVSPGR